MNDIENQFNNSGVKLSDSKITKKNLYSKIAPPNTFKNRNDKQDAPKIFQRYEKNIYSSQITNPYINAKSNYSKKSFISNNNIFDLYPDSDIKLSNNINSSYREAKLVKGNLFNNNLNNIKSPKNVIIQKTKNNINRLEKNISKNKYIIKNKSVYVKKGKNNILNNYNPNKINGEIKKAKTNKVKDNVNVNIVKNDNDINSIKEKYDFLLKKTQNLLSKYQHIVEYYQNKEKENNIKNKI